MQRRFVVRGRVQGVWYRDACRREAERLGIAGWARNCEDGTVEVIAEGEPSALDDLQAWCHIGPPRALVTAVETHPSAVPGLHGFRTR